MPKQTDLARAIAELELEAETLDLQLSERRSTLDRLRTISKKPKPAAKRTRTAKKEQTNESL